MTTAPNEVSIAHLPLLMKTKYALQRYLGKPFEQITLAEVAEIGEDVLLIRVHGVGNKGLLGIVGEMKKAGIPTHKFPFTTEKFEWLSGERKMAPTRKIKATLNNKETKPWVLI